MLKKLLPSLLIGIFLIQVLGFSVYFSFEKSKIRHELKAMILHGVPTEKLLNFQFSKKHFDQIVYDGGKEIKVEGHFYDIITKKKIQNGNILITCVDDVQETKLFKNLAFLVDDNISKQTNSPLKTIFSIVIKPMLLNDSKNQLTYSPNFSSLHKDFFFYFKKKSKFHPTYFSPPPDFSA